MQKKEFRTSGSALIIIIVAMVLVSVLSLTVVSLTGTGALDTVVYNNNKRAYYLAESGYRYAAGLYLNTENKDEEGTADDEKAEVLRNQIDGGAYTLPDGGKFFLTAFPYWLMPNSDYMGQILGTFHFPGQIPKDFGIPEAGVMAYSHAEKEGEKIALFHYSGAVVSSSTRTITCTLGARLAAGLFCDIKTKDALFLALPLSLSGNSTVGLTGGSLQLKLPAAGANRCIPPYNGVFIWGADNTKEYLYKKAEFKDNTVTLRGITKMDGSPVATGFVADVTANPAQGFLVFKRNLALTSKGEAGEGDLASVRTIDYNMPISSSGSEDKGELAKKEIVIDSKKKLTDNFEALSGTSASFETFITTNDLTGQHVKSPGASIRNVNPENGKKLGLVALRVKKPGSSELADAQIALREAWKKNNHFLEYDVQAEFSFLVSLLYGGSGLSFRMSKDGKEYLALSFMKFYTPSLVYRHNGNHPDMAGGTLRGQKDGQVLFSGVRCLGNAEPNHFYYYNNDEKKMYEKIEQNIWRVAIYPEDYSQIADKFGELNDAELVLTAADGQEHALGTASYLHEFTAWHRDKGNYGKGKFSPYYWPGYNDFIHQEVKPLVADVRMGSMNDWWYCPPAKEEERKNNPRDYYNFFSRDKGYAGTYSPYKIFDRLVLVLWEQYKDKHGKTKRRWLAAKDMTADGHILGSQNDTDGQVVHDDTTLLIRLREGYIQGVKTNLINVFYGDKTRHEEPANNKPYDMARKTYPPGLIVWPPLSLDAWTADDDYFTHIQSVIQPDGSLDKSCNWDFFNPEVKVGEGQDEIKVFGLKDDGTILLSRFTSPEAPANQSNEFTPEEEIAWAERPEIGFHALGDFAPVSGDKKRAASMSGFGLRTVISGEAGHLKGGFLPGQQR